jgi:hypothetical protein
MIYGDPFKFALQFSVVSAWNNDDVWSNGLFAMYIDGASVFSPVDAIELRTTFSFYKSISFDEADRANSSVSAEELFQNADNYFTGDGEVLLDGVLNLTCTAMGDQRFYVYLMKAANGDRLVWSLDNGSTVVEKVLGQDEIAGVIRRMPSVLPSLT